MYFVKTPAYLKQILPGAIWSVPDVKGIYLTFDDGPVTGVTDVVLDLLAEYQATATFFCIGDNVRKHHDLFKRIRNEGHVVGNHTFNHLNGWRTPLSKYLANTEQCNGLVSAELFRPPYGRITLRQLRQIRKDYKVIMWDVLSGDFDVRMTSDKCAANVIENIEDGSIVVFHDSEKAAPRMLGALEKVLQHVKKHDIDTLLL